MAICAAAVVSAGAQAPPRDLHDWKLEYSVSGGFVPSLHYLRLSRDGNLAAGDGRLGDQVVGRASTGLMANLEAFLKSARPAPKKHPMPDTFSASLVLTTEGRSYELELPRDLSAVLEAAWNDAVAWAVVGSWRQSAWKLCKPVPQLAATDVDPPIDDLDFRGDGTFSVTWRGGGARTTGIPHVQAAPDYRGRYSVTPATGAIRMQIDNGLFVPVDFSGQGQFAVAGNQLTVRGAWFGTRHAKQKPDICELTFTKNTAP
jgi:hypothetical protein